MARKTRGKSTRITDTEIRKPSASGYTRLSETLIHGHGNLIARITPKGERIFYFRYTDEQGKRIDLRIGSYSMGGSGEDQKRSLAKARAYAQLLAELHQSGIKNIREHLDEQKRMELEAKAEAERQKQAEAAAKAAREAAEKRELESRPTVADLFDRWCRVKLIAHKDKGDAVIRIFQKDVLPEIGHLYASTVTKAHITQVTDRQIERGTSRLANRTFVLMRQMFRFGMGRGIVSEDPTTTLSKADIAGKDVERDRVLSEDEIRDLYKKIPDAGLLPSTESAIWIALSTACRIGELTNARWEHIDFDTRQWFIPAENSKNGKPHIIFLSTFAVNAFHRLQAWTGESPWCYPGREHDTPVSPKSITKQITDRQTGSDRQPLAGRSSKHDALILQGGDWTPHDLRRTGATIMVALGVLPEVAERCLNHTERDRVKRTYQRHNYTNEMRDAWRLLGERLELLCSEESNIITLGDRRTRA